MGTYLSTPVTEKCQESGESTKPTAIPVQWGVVDMQGWRKSMEDSHIAISDVSIPIAGDPRAESAATKETDTIVTNTSEATTVCSNDDKTYSSHSSFMTATATTDAKIFGVFDGHGGPEVARFCSLYLESVLQNQSGWKCTPEMVLEPSSTGLAKDHTSSTECDVGEDGSIVDSTIESGNMTNNTIGEALVSAFHALDRMIDDPNRRDEIIQLRSSKPEPGEVRKADFIPPPLPQFAKKKEKTLTETTYDAEENSSVCATTCSEDSSSDASTTADGSKNVVASSGGEGTSTGGTVMRTTTDEPVDLLVSPTTLPMRSNHENIKNDEVVGASVPVQNNASVKEDGSDGGNATMNTTITGREVDVPDYPPSETVEEKAKYSGVIAGTVPSSITSSPNVTNITDATTDVSVDDSMMSSKVRETDTKDQAVEGTKPPVPAIETYGEDDDDCDFEDADSHEAVGLEDAADDREIRDENDPSALLDKDDDDENDHFDDAVKDLDDVVIEVVDGVDICTVVAGSESGDSRSQSSPSNQNQQQHPPQSTAGKVSIIFQRLLNLSAPAGQIVMQIGTNVGGAAASIARNNVAVTACTSPTHSPNALDISMSTSSSGIDITAPGNMSNNTGTNVTLLAPSSAAVNSETENTKSLNIASSPSKTPIVSTLCSLSTTPSIVRNGQMTCNLQDHPIHAGATAVVAVLIGRTLTVANAGDSRAVLCRGQTTIPLSFDHKPMHDRELNRIRRAGGFVNSFGRVNGNLNLSRSIGDLKYKQVCGFPPEEQLITAEPDIRQVQLTSQDEFILLGCDGIWDCLTNEKAVEYVRERIDTMTLTEIGIEMLNTIISEDPRMTQGIGGDNMTILIVDLQPHKRQRTTTTGGTGATSDIGSEKDSNDYTNKISSTTTPTH